VHFVLAARNLGLSGDITLAECGPGRGTLMRDVVRTLRMLAPHLSLHVALVETSPRLRDMQKEALEGLVRPVFLDAVEALPVERPVLLVANEFLDALPFRQFAKQGDAWRERVVDVAAEGFAFTTGHAVMSPADLPPSAALQPDGAIFEASPAREAAVQTLASLLARCGGAGLFIDYGHARSGFGDTFQAMRDHAFHDVLADPGMADLTSHVDFEPLMEAARRAGCAASILEQGRFLLDLGLLERAGRLGADKDGATRRAITDAVERLAGPDAMGRLFKVMTVSPEPDTVASFDPAG
jgi:SAM-dependent MidA family methyltransferase